MFTGWIYDHLNARGAIAKVGHPAMLKAIGVGLTLGPAEFSCVAEFVIELDRRGANSAGAAEGS